MVRAERKVIVCLAVMVRGERRMYSGLQGDSRGKLVVKHIEILSKTSCEGGVENSPSPGRGWGGGGGEVTHVSNFHSCQYAGKTLSFT
jgi:hypothetical protein